MLNPKKFLWNNLARITGIILLIGLFGLSSLPKMPPSEVEAFRNQFRFSATDLFQPEGENPKTLRAVHPQYERISAWISSVGAAISIFDADADGLQNDLCHVDPRYDKVLISTAPNTGSRFKAFHLNPEPLPYDPETMAPMGCVPADWNEDGRMDVLVYYWGRTPIIYLNGEKEYTPVELSNPPGKWFSNAGTSADFDGDGHFDILIGNYFPDRSSVLDASATDKDQVMQHSMSRAFNGALNRLFLWKGKNSKNTPVFIEETSWLDHSKNPLDWTLALAAADINGDLLPEIYVANDFGPDRMLYNQSEPGKIKFTPLYGKRKLQTTASNVLGKDSFKGMGADFTDVNGDGLLDIYISNIAAEYALEESHFCFVHNGKNDLMAMGIAPYVNRSEALGLSRSSWGWDSKLADFNNDGIPEAIQATGFVKGKINRWPELQELAIGNDELLSTPEAWPRFQPGDDLCGNAHNPFFVLSKNGQFFDLASELGIAEKQVSRGIAIGDIDRDGDLDFVVANQWEPSHLYTNNMESAGLFLGLTLFLPLEKGVAPLSIVDPEARLPLRHAIGAQVYIKDGNNSRITDYVDGGNGHSGTDSKEIFFGLQSNDNPEIQTEVHWRDPSGKVRTETFPLKPGWHTIVLGW